MISMMKATDSPQRRFGRSLIVFLVALMAFAVAPSLAQEGNSPEFSGAAASSITGRIYQANGTTPITSGVRIEVYTPAAAWVTHTYVQGDGTYTVPLANGGQYRILARGDNYVGGSGNYALEFYNNRGADFFSGDVITVPNGGNLPNINFAMEPGGIITGRITDQNTGQPIPNMVAELYQTWLGVCTNSQGYYTIYNVPLNVGWRVYGGTLNNWCPGGAQNYQTEFWQEVTQVAQATPVTLTSGGQVRSNINFTLSTGSGPVIPLRNTDFSSGLDYWTFSATPGSPTGGGARAANGRAEIWRNAGSSQAVLYQGYWQYSLDWHQTLEASFYLANVSNYRRRVTVLIYEGSQWWDIISCSFWLPPWSQPALYRVRGNTTHPEGWGLPSVSFYLSTVERGSPSYLAVDSVTLQRIPGVNPFTTTCTDPLAPNPPGGGDGANLIRNGSFSSGMQYWSTYAVPSNAIGHNSASGGVFQFYRAGGSSQAVVLQNTGSAVPNNTTLEATFSLGNSSGQRKRVYAIMHDADWSDVIACSFYMFPNKPMGTFTMRGITTEGWSSASLSVYASTADSSGWIQLDNVLMRTRPSVDPNGTVCEQPTTSVSDISLELESAARAGELIPTLEATATPVVPSVEVPVQIEPPLLATPVPFEGSEGGSTGEGQFTE
jgi:hypothetical protein